MIGKIKLGLTNIEIFLLSLLLVLLDITNIVIANFDI